MRRIKIQNTAPQRELADAVHLVPPLVTGMYQTSSQILGGMFLAGMKGHGVFLERFRRQGILQKRLDPTNDHRDFSLYKTAQHFQTGKFIFPADPLHIPEGKFPRRVDRGSVLPRKSIDILTQPGRHRLVRCYHQKRPCLGQSCRYRCFMDMPQTGHFSGPSSFCHGRQQRPILWRG